MKKKNKQSLPYVSVIFAAKKIDKFFDTAVKSIINQKYQNLEVIFLIERDYNLFISKINKLFKRKKIFFKIIKIYVPGFAHCLNVGIENAKGDFVARMDTDDVSHKNRILKQIEFFNENPDYSLVGTNAHAIDENGLIIKNIKLPYFKTNYEIKKALPYRNPIYHSSILVRKSVFLKYGAYKYDYYAQDHELWIRLSLKKEVKFYNLPEKLYYYRRHAQQETNIQNSWRAFYDISGFMFKYFLLTKNLKYIFGIIVVFPFFRIIRQKLKKIL